jgi:hypothetical protein
LEISNVGNIPLARTRSREINKVLNKNITREITNKFEIDADKYDKTPVSKVIDLLFKNDIQKQVNKLVSKINKEEDIEGYTIKYDYKNKCVKQEQKDGFFKQYNELTIKTTVNIYATKQVKEIIKVKNTGVLTINNKEYNIDKQEHYKYRQRMKLLKELDVVKIQMNVAKYINKIKDMKHNIKTLITQINNLDEHYKKEKIELRQKNRETKLAKQIENNKSI